MNNMITKPRTYVPPSGIRASAKLLIVGDQPNVPDIMRGKPFSGSAGDVLNDCLAAANLVRGECYITHVIKDLDYRLPHYFVSGRNGSHFTEEGQAYVTKLRDELNASPCKFIIAVGNVALLALASRTGITKWRGSVIESTLCPGKWVIPIIHPGTVNAPKFVYLNKPLIIFDLKRAAQLINQGDYQPYEYTADIRPSFLEAKTYLSNILENREYFANTQTPVAYDIEVVHEEVSCISFCHSPTRVISIAFVDQQGDIFNCEQELELWRLIARILEDPSIRKLGQNLTFDSHFLLRKYGIRIASLDDTMIAQQIIMPDYPKGLDFITSLHTPLPYYKDEGKKWFRLGGSWEQLWHYNCLDSLACFLAWPEQKAEIIRQDNEATYRRQSRVVLPLVYMMEHGIRADVPGIEAAHDKLVAEAEQCLAKLHELAGRELNPNSSQQLQQYFYEEKRFPRYKSKTTGNTTVDADALKRIARKGSEEARLILRYRKNLKQANTYLVREKFDADGRIRCSYNPVGTRYSRLSSSSNIFGTGMNLQNWPHGLLHFLSADDGYAGYSFDLSQAENRHVAYYGLVEAMIDAFENHKDVHSLTAGLIFSKQPDQVTTDDNTCSLGDGTHSERFWGKKANHGLNYDLGYKNFALYYEMPERDSEFIVNRYHTVYPGVRQVYHKSVRDQLYASRTVTNLMGRKTLFLGKLDDATFKEAYSCIPQGTVGDVINERGLNYIYYDPDNHGFQPVELLSQTHDDISFQIPLSLPWSEHARLLMAIKAQLEIPCRIHGREYIVPADLTFFKKCKRGSEFKGPKFPATPELLAQALAAAWPELEGVKEAV